MERDMSKRKLLTSRKPSAFRLTLKGSGLAILLFAPMLVIIPLGVAAQGMRKVCGIKPKQEDPHRQKL